MPRSRYYFIDPNTKCVGDCVVPDTPDFHAHDRDCGDLIDDTACWGGDGKRQMCTTDCYQTESVQNNFIALRTGTGVGTGILYAEFQTGDAARKELPFDEADFVEMYDSAADMWQMNNIAHVATKAQLDELHERVQKEFRCAGDSCL